MRALSLLLLLLLVVESRADESIRLLREFSLSPDGAEIYFAWRGDIWSHPLQGGSAKRLTAHPAIERFPRLSPDGKTLAFVSNRTGANQVYTMPVAGGDPKQQTHHSEGSLVSDWYPDGKAMLIKGNRDNFWRSGDRYFRRVLDGSADRMLFDGYGHSAQVSPDGKQLLFCREGVSWTRKGYRGPQSSQIWLFDFASRVFTRQTEGEFGERSPVWVPDASGYFFTAQRDGAFNLFRRQLESGQTVQLTRFKDDGVLFPALSRNGAVIVFRVGFDLYRMDASGGEPERLKLIYRGDAIHERVSRAQLARARQVAFSNDGREVAFIAGGDLWVMDTELKEPRRITRTPEEERDPVFAPDHKSILFVSDKGGQADLWTAKRADEKRHWWRNEAFELKQLTDDEAPESDPRFIKGGRVAFTNLRGDLWTMKADGTDRKLVFDSWNPPSFDFSPDGKWVAYAIEDNDFNRDIWIRAADGSGEPVNVTRHPDWESSPTFSADGKMLAFVGRRNHEEVDLHYVFLRKQDDDESKRDRTIEKAEKKMKGRKDPSKAKKKAPPKSPFQKWVEDWAKKQKAAKQKKPAPKKKKPTIDFDGISDRIRRIEIAGVSESGPFWSHDSKKLVFRAKIDGKEGLWTVSPPDEVKPKSLSTTKGSGWRWLKEGNQIVGLAGGRPTSLSASGKPTAFAFRVPNEVDLPARNRAAFDLCWRVMRDSWYDERFNNRDWNAVRAKYREMAGTVTVDELDQVVDMMLGELNGSHLGFSARGAPAFRAPAWRDVTPHFGTRFDDSFEGPGLKVTSVIEGSPAWRTKSRIEKGEVILSADGKPLDPGRDLALQLNGRPNRDVRLRVKDRKGKERDVVIRPMSYGQVRGLLYDEWQQRNRDYVTKRSDGKLGYLHVRGMNWSSFEKFEAELYKVGHGKDGLLIDVRDNSGGFTADHLLTVLCQPVHAVTVPRGGKVGYPQGRMVYARWHKPVTVLCNQNSFSNAEIFAHAIRSLERGRVVGVRTAGGVISTGGRGIMEFGFLRLPFRGWFLAKSGRDMELNGCVPDFEIWPRPEEWATGVDRQLAKGVDLLAGEVKEWRERPQKPLRFRSGAEVERGTEEE
ncbi:MAG: S41 family peptidase [Planctomycetota bacterium]|jgi:tricorn protease